MYELVEDKVSLELQSVTKRASSQGMSMLVEMMLRSEAPGSLKLLELLEDTSTYTARALR